MDSKDSVYLEVAEVRGNEICGPIYTYISVFVVSYCQNKDVNIYFVKSESSSESSIPSQLVEHLNVKFIEKEMLPQYVKDSHLPALVSKDEQTCVGGLCAVLRWTIKTKCKMNPEGSFSSLLGFRGGCLMACSENSIWTKFVEVDMPQTVAKFQEKMNTEKASVMIPTDLMKLEMHLRQPVKTHNILKRKQDFYKESKTKQGIFISESERAFNLGNLSNCISEIQNSKQFNALKKLDKSCSDVNLPHCFVEGVDFTLADLILLPCVHQLLALLIQWKRSVECHLPLVLMWYKRVLETKQCIKMAKLWGLGIWTDSVGEQENDLHAPEVENESLYSRDPSRSKPRIRNRDPSDIINKLKISGIHPTYSSFPSEGCENIDWDMLPRAVHPAGGDLPPNRVQRKCQQIESVVRAVLSLATSSCVIVDFCAGTCGIINSIPTSILQSYLG